MRFQVYEIGITSRNAWSLKLFEKSEVGTEMEIHSPLTRGDAHFLQDGLKRDSRGLCPSAEARFF